MNFGVFFGDTLVSSFVLPVLNFILIVLGVPLIVLSVAFLEVPYENWWTAVKKILKFADKHGG